MDEQKSVRFAAVAFAIEHLSLGLAHRLLRPPCLTYDDIHT
ncbi:hypothetical protein [Streptomyces sp. NPDC048385]